MLLTITKKSAYNKFHYPGCFHVFRGTLQIAICILAAAEHFLKKTCVKHRKKCYILVVNT